MCGDMRFKVTAPSNGAWFCYDLHVTVEGAFPCGDQTCVFTNVLDDSRWYKRAWHWIARPFR